MMFVLAPSQLDTGIRRGLWYMVIGFPLLVVVAVMHRGPIISATMATFAGAMCGVFTSMNWRRERGVWMLAVLFLLAALPLYAAMPFHEILGSKAGMSMLQLFDLGAATAVVGHLCRILASVAIRNWRAHHPAPQ